MGGRLRLGMLLLAGWMVGCGPVPIPAARKPTPAVPPVAKTLPAQPESVEPPVAKPAPKAEEEMAEEPASDEADSEKAELEKREKELLASLAKEPKNTELLLQASMLMQRKARQTESGEPDYALFKKSADYLHQAIAADAKVKDEPLFNLVAAETIYNEACALSLEKQTEPALKALKEAVELGWTNVPLIQTDKDLANLREHAEFDSVLALAREKQRLAVVERVNSLFENVEDFAFEFDLKDTEGKPVTKAEFKGKVLMVNVWGTWCPPCRRELPDLVAAYTKFKPQGFEVVGLNTENETGDEANELIKESMKTYNINYRCALGEEKTFQQIPDFSAVPTTLFFDREGKLKARLIGMADEITLELVIERMLKESPQPAAPEGEKKPAEEKPDAKPTDEKPTDAKPADEK